MKFIYLIIALLLIAVPAYANGGNDFGWGGHMFGMMGWPFFGFGFIFMIIFGVVIVLGIFALVKWLSDQGEAKQNKNSALEILKERYAKGEINKEEFNEKKEDLE